MIRYLFVHTTIGGTHRIVVVAELAGAGDFGADSLRSARRIAESAAAGLLANGAAGDVVRVGIYLRPQGQSGAQARTNVTQGQGTNLAQLPVL